MNSAISAFFGLLRWKLGRFLLGLFILRNKRAEQEQLFTRAWTFVHRLKWLFIGRQLYRNRFQTNWKNLMFIELVGAVKQHNPSFVPKLIIKNHQLLTDLVAQSSSIIVATIHTGTETSLNRMLEELGIKSSVIAASKNRPQRNSALIGLKGTVDIIARSGDTLLIARQKMREGMTICCCADFTIREIGTLYHDLYMATGLFDFAKWAGARIIYAIPTLSGTGEIIINLSKPNIDENNSTSAGLALDFIQFISTATKEKQTWKIGSWPLKTSYSHRQYSRYWINRAA